MVKIDLYSCLNYLYAIILTIYKDIHLKIGKLHKDEIHGKILDNAGFVSYFHFDEGVGGAIP